MRRRHGRKHTVAWRRERAVERALTLEGQWNANPWGIASEHAGQRAAVRLQEVMDEEWPRAWRPLPWHAFTAG